MHLEALRKKCLNCMEKAKEGESQRDPRRPRGRSKRPHRGYRVTKAEGSGYGLVLCLGEMGSRTLTCWVAGVSGVGCGLVKCRSLGQRTHLLLIMMLRPDHVSLKICLVWLSLVREKLMEGTELDYCMQHPRHMGRIARFLAPWNCGSISRSLLFQTPELCLFHTGSIW